MTPAQTIEQKIADLRRFGLSDKAIADKCGCSLHTIYNFRYGITKSINRDVADAISKLHSAIDWGMIDEQ